LNEIENVDSNVGSTQELKQAQPTVSHNAKVAQLIQEIIQQRAQAKPEAKSESFPSDGYKVSGNPKRINKLYSQEKTFCDVSYYRLIRQMEMS